MGTRDRERILIYTNATRKKMKMYYYTKNISVYEMYMEYTLRTVIFKTVSKKMIEVQKVQWLTRILKFPKKC